MTTRTTEAAEPLPALVKTVEVELPPDDAFRLFTDRVATWWPLRTHSVGGDDATLCVIEGWVGGRFYERVRDGAEHVWGRILAWEPSSRLVMTWHPGRDTGTAQEVEVRFEPSARGTLVTLEHRGWDRRGTPDVAEESRTDYDTGWDLVLGRFVTTAASARA